jgi:hypothetical protein
MGGPTMSGDALAKGFQALAAVPAGEEFILAGSPTTAVYVDRVPANPTFPYVLITTNFPTVAERSFSRSRSAYALRSRMQVVGLTAESVRIIAQILVELLEGKRPAVAGWTLGAIESVPNEQPLQADLDVTMPGTAANPLYQPFDWILTGSRS